MRRPSLLGITLLGLVLAAGCATTDDPTVDDTAADQGSEVDLAKIDAASLAGTYRWSYETRPYWANDIPSLELGPAGYTRTRCYGWDCANLVPQLGKVSVVHSSDKTYLRFKSFVKVEVNGELVDHTVTADTYEVLKTTHGIKLRKTYSTRWFYLTKVTPEQACTASGGDWSAAACACPTIAGDWSHYIDFFPGLGGCFEIFATTEDGCDSTGGSYLDDDRSAIGTYCMCPLGTYETNAGCDAL